MDRFDSTPVHLRTRHVESAYSAVCRMLTRLVNSKPPFKQFGYIYRMAAACFPHSGDWLTALPIASCGLCVDNEGMRVAVGLPLGLDLCSPHMCQCGGAVSSDGHHGLACRLSKGRSIRHHAINDIIWRSLQNADVPSMKEPSGLLRNDVKRPDGATLIPWKIHGLGCHSGPHLCCIILVVDNILRRFFS